MISINCTQCQQLLEMDEAFAGGVCRCQYCGTIQTVPSHLKKPTPAAAVAPAKAVHPGGGSGTGLDDLAEVVASSGLSRSSLAKKGRTAQRGGAAAAAAPARNGGSRSAAVEYATPERQRRSPMLALLLAATAVLVLVGVVGFFLMKRGTSPP